MAGVDHYPIQIGTHDAEGHRTFEPPGDVCSGCSNPATGHWVPVSFCPAAYRVFVSEGVAVLGGHPPKPCVPVPCPPRDV